jgi:BirA family biotin operon repressor/biotin-[acetyl-CoA-carboxylase] ligase
MRRAFALLDLLSDGAEHGGTELAEALGVTRAAVWHQVAQLREQGMVIAASRGHGYQLPGGFEALSAESIRAQLSGPARDALLIETVTLTDSTNERLLAALNSGDIHGQVLLAEHQTAGRGRRGDRWLSPPGSGLCLSLGWRFDQPPATFSALSLVVGMAITESLRELGVSAAMLKWPNDILYDGGKLAGILIEMRSEAGGPCRTVIGIGINVQMSAQARALIDQPVEDFTHASGQAVSRNRLAAVLLSALARTLPQFGRDGFAVFRQDWLRYDALVGQAVKLELPNRTVLGTARGVDDHGALIIEHDGGRETFVSGHLARA